MNSYKFISCQTKPEIYDMDSSFSWQLSLRRTLVLKEEDAAMRRVINNAEFKFYVSVFALLLFDLNVQVSDTRDDEQ